MKPIADYPVTFGYGATSLPYSKAAPHRGNDRAAATGTPVIVGGVQIGLVGATGWAIGSHLHAQAGTDFFAQQTIDPTGHEFKGGEVVHTGTASQWGNYVIVQNTSGIFVVYAHLSKITTTTGTVLNVMQGGTNMRIGAGDNWRWRFNRLHRQLVRNGDMPDAVFKSIVGQDAWKIVESWSDHPEANRLTQLQELGEAAEKQLWATRVMAAEKAHRDTVKIVADLRSAIENTAAKTKAEKDGLIMQLANLTENLAVTQDKYEAAKKKAELNKPPEHKEVNLNVSADTRNWIEKLISLFRR